MPGFTLLRVPQFLPDLVPRRRRLIKGCCMMDEARPLELAALHAHSEG